MLAKVLGPELSLAEEDFADRKIGGHRPALPRHEGAEAEAFQPKPCTASVLGTPGYMAPEQARGEVETLGPGADIYSLGVVLKFLVVGTTTTSKALAAIANKATAGEAQQRYSSVTELADDIAHYLDGLPVSAYPEGVMTRLWRWTVGNRAWLLLIVAYLVMRAVFILWRAR